MPNEFQGFDPSKVKPNVKPQAKLVPAGVYKLMLLKAHKKPTKSNNGELASLKFEVCDGEHKGAGPIYENLNLWNKSKDSSQIAWGQLSALCQAMGISYKINGFEDILKKTFTAELKVSEFNGKMKNEIVEYKTPEPASVDVPIAESLSMESESDGSNKSAPWETS